MSDVVLETNLRGMSLFARGKVRDVYDLGGELLFVATDRISAFDVVLPNGIPQKGAVLTQLSAFWFADTARIVRNHLISTEVRELPAPLHPYSELLRGRSMRVRRARRIDAECVVRGYLAGSGWIEYQRDGAICGIKLPPGLRESDRLPEPIFTPATKAETGHDENITFDRFVEVTGSRELADRLRELSIKVYLHAARRTRDRGILLADTKMEFGLLDGEVILIDELITPDSSRFWDEAAYQPGRPQASFDKQYVRDFLNTTGWDKTPPGPELPPEVVARTSAKYLEAYRRITGTELSY